MRNLVLCILHLLVTHTFAFAAVLHVPGSYSTIQSAILAASAGDTVLVAPGTYSENINFRGKNIVVASRYLFSRDNMDILNTVLFGGNPAFSDTASCVLFISGEDSTAVLDGFTLIGGTGTSWTDEHGAGRFVEGGGILIQHSSPTIRNNRIMNNEAIRMLPGNRSAGAGAIRVGDACPHIINNLISGNKGMYGGGIVLNYSGAIIKNNIITANTVSQAVAGVTTYGGGGIWAIGHSDLPKIIENNTITLNSSSGTGSSLAGRGGGILTDDVVRFYNNIVWGNTQTIGTQVSTGGGADLDAKYNDVEDGVPGTENISLDPLLDYSYMLTEASPCIDAGNPASDYNDPADPLSNTTAQLFSRGTVRNDIGAYGGPLRTPKTIFIAINSGANGTIRPLPAPPIELQSMNVPEGENVTFWICPDTGFIIENVSINEVTIGKPSIYTFTDLRNQSSIGATFQRGYSIAVSKGEHGTVSPSGTILIPEGQDTVFNFSAERGYLIDSVIIDNSYVGSPHFYAFENVSNNHNLRVTFRFDSTYLTSYRTFHPDSIAYDKDNTGKTGSAVKRKADKVIFAFHLSAPATASLRLKFSLKTTGAITVDSDTVLAWVNSADILTPSTLPNGSVVSIEGIGSKGSKLKTQYTWGTLPKPLKGTVPDSSYTANQLCLPMPNRINAFAELFKQNAFNGLLSIGYPMPELKKTYGWVNLKTYDDIVKSLSDKKSGVHSGSARNFDNLSSGKPMLGSFGSLPPSKHNNRLFAAALALKGSIAASELAITPPGFGELIFDDGTANPLNGMTLNQLSTLCDSMLSARATSSLFRSKNEYNALYGYVNLDTVIRKVLGAFEGTLDTTNGGFSGVLSFTGSSSLFSHPFLKNSSSGTASIHPSLRSTKSETPENFTLYQNYPNPFNPSTTIRFTLATVSYVRLTLYNILGQEITTLMNGIQQAGDITLEWDGTDFSGGIYFYRLNIETTHEDGTIRQHTLCKKMLLVK